MITEKDLQEAIAECEGQRNPNASTCVKLAAYYIIKDHMFDGNQMSYSFSTGPSVPVIDSTYESDTEFSDLIKKKGITKLMPIIDELMTTLSVVNPRLYSSTIQNMESVI